MLQARLFGEPPERVMAERSRYDGFPPILLKASGMRRGPDDLGEKAIFSARRPFLRFHMPAAGVNIPAKGPRQNARVLDRDGSRSRTRLKTAALYGLTMASAPA
jgi:hypothetical protein